ncbi:TauD/TfdA family dioxygenase [Vreelandella janggokensis]|uniref:TauD/TfdA family dioxygenase n=1 Tax=Vreelandella janggokensis TaxID=370767 RepID=A0ABT4IW02_9GAMM|nr:MULTISPECIES: TauD/TfdA family dioxygenase [Halomonas]MCW4150484.1 TauD/TfdA family dioxygenase [Halomonas sp. 18H]MCZ0927142.1 TauD/TfdA family dioxygenase [Halomonas janggokensis]MCZ0929650.1 TauD/TfdA family dioxygenase [Halomonas janggokensis]MDR5886148.1 TauD/TfdA family dioxygenase [Halomonas janggokensis]
MPNRHALIVHEQPPSIVIDEGDHSQEISPLWLRERTRAPDQLESMTQQRLFDSHAIDSALTLESAVLVDEHHVVLAFSDGHKETYDLRVLADELDDNSHFPCAEPWDASLNQDRLRFDWPRTLDDPAYFQASLDAYLRYGYIILQGVPTDPEQILQVGSHFGYVKETNFGRYFEVYSRPTGNDLAYRSVALGPHTDNPYRSPVPGIQLLHCLVNETTGGLSTLADSLKVLEQLRAENPEGYALLKRTPVRFRFIDAGTELVTHRTMIQTNDDGHPTGVHYSPRLDALPLLSDAQTRLFHRARQRLGELLTDPAYEVRFPLAAGDLMMFDNSRVLHGRTSYNTDEGHRHVQGCYLDTDGPRERFASLMKQQGLMGKVA